MIVVQSGLPRSTRKKKRKEKKIPKRTNHEKRTFIVDGNDRFFFRLSFYQMVMIGGNDILRERIIIITGTNRIFWLPRRLVTMQLQ